MRWTRETQRRPCLDYGERAAMTRSGAERALADHVQDDSPFRVDLDETNDAILRNSFRRPTHQDLSGLHADSAIGEHHCILPMPAIHAALGLSVYPKSALVKKPIGNHHSSTTYTRHHHSPFTRSFTESRLGQAQTASPSSNGSLIRPRLPLRLLGNRPAQ